MISKFFDKLLKIFFAFLSIVIVTGFVFFTIRNYVMPQVTVTKPLENSMLIKKDYFTGRVASSETIEVKADRKLYIEEINVKNSQIVEPGSKIITLDMSRQVFNTDTEAAELQNQIKIYEIEKLNLKNQMNSKETSVQKALEAYDKAKEEYENTSYLYENGIVTKEELDRKNDVVEEHRKAYENEISSRESEAEIYAMNLNRIDGEIKILQDKLQGKINEGNENKITVDSDGVYFLSDKVYIDYIIDKKVAEEGETVIRYSICNTNADLFMEAYLDIDIYDDIFNKKHSLYFWKNDERKKDSVSVQSVRSFPDHNELIFSLRDELREKVYISDSVRFMVQAEENYECVVQKTAVVPIGEMKSGNYCYIYTIVSEDSILGQINYLKQGEYKILAVGDNTVAVEPSQPNTPRIDRNTLIANYVSSVLENEMRVRIIN
ncbi:hypothetical protein [Sedimentibacter sp.]|uniref:hypothetical protein n=1 Tax=Sedimentibacter sp. TaxID=1960295 RepID=UPI00289F37AE|nr:hypothetical protein [Sedimentibacter sp.]